MEYSYRHGRCQDCTYDRCYSRDNYHRSPSCYNHDGAFAVDSCNHLHKASELPMEVHVRLEKEEKKHPKLHGVANLACTYDILQIERRMPKGRWSLDSLPFLTVVDIGSSLVNIRITPTLQSSSWNCGIVINSKWYHDCVADKRDKKKWTSGSVKNSGPLIEFYLITLRVQIKV